MSNGYVMGRLLCTLCDVSWNLLFYIITMDSRKKEPQNICNSRVNCQEIPRCQLCNSHKQFLVHLRYCRFPIQFGSLVDVNLIQGARVRENLARFTAGQQTPESLYIRLKSQRSMVDTNIRYKYREVIKIHYNNV